MMDLSFLKIENLIRIKNLIFKEIFKIEKNIKTETYIEKVEQHIQQTIVLPDKLPQLLEGGEQSIKQLTKTVTPLIVGASDSFFISEEEKRQINSRIDEAVALMNLNRMDEARTNLLTTLGEIKNKPDCTKEQVRVFNNLGVIYNRPKPDGNYDEAIKYFNEALTRDSNFVKSKMNLASAYINKLDDESVNKGNDLIQALWTTEKTPEILQVLLWGIYQKEKSSDKVLEFIDKEKKIINPLTPKKDSLLNLLAAFYLESGKVDEAIQYNEKALALSPDDPAFVTMKARTLMLKAQEDFLIPSEFDIIPKFNDYKNVKEAEILFKKALDIADKQKLDYLIPEIRYGISTCKLWLGKYDEAKYTLKQIKIQELPDLFAHQVNVLNFATHIHERDFETAYKLLVESDSYSKIKYQEKFRMARVFLYNGAPEQAKMIYDSITLDAEKYQDITYWLDLSAVYVLLNKQQEAIGAATKVKKMSEDKDDKIRKTALSHYNAIMHHYSKRIDTKDSETGRLIEGMFEFQKKFPEEKIITPIKVLDEDGQPTDEIKDMLSKMRDRYEIIKKTFKENPIPIYHLEKTFHRPFSDLMAYRDDPEFTIPFTDVNDSFKAELENNFKEAEAFIFDYLALLDLAKMDFLGFLEKLKKPIYIHQLLFQKIQEELLENETEELRELWEFLRHSKLINFIENETNVELKSEKLDDLFDEWLVETIKFAKAKNYSICTNDLRMYMFLKSEDIKPINITVLLKDWLDNEIIDEKMYSRAIGDLAERFYVFLSYQGEDLFEIVLEDGGKITPRSYHLVREVFLPGSILQSFTPVYAKFIDLFWRTGSLPQEKVNWIKFLTNIITEIIDRDFISLKESKIISKEESDVAMNKFYQKLKPAITSLAFMWKVATNNGSKDDLRELLKIVDKVLDKEYLVHSRPVIEQGIKEKLKE